MAYTYLTTEELCSIKFDPRTIRNQLKDSVLPRRVALHIRPFGGRKLLFLWEPIEEEMLAQSNVRVVSD